MNADRARQAKADRQQAGKSGGELRRTESSLDSMELIALQEQITLWGGACLAGSAGLDSTLSCRPKK